MSREEFATLAEIKYSQANILRKIKETNDNLNLIALIVKQLMENQEEK